MRQLWICSIVRKQQRTPLKDRDSYFLREDRLWLFILFTSKYQSKMWVVKWHDARISMMQKSKSYRHSTTSSKPFFTNWICLSVFAYREWKKKEGREIVFPHPFSQRRSTGIQKRNSSRTSRAASPIDNTDSIPLPPLTTLRVAGAIVGRGKCSNTAVFSLSEPEQSDEALTELGEGKGRKGTWKSETETRECKGAGSTSEAVTSHRNRKRMCENERTVLSSSYPMSILSLPLHHVCTIDQGGHPIYSSMNMWFNILIILTT